LLTEAVLVARPAREAVTEIVTVAPAPLANVPREQLIARPPLMCRCRPWSSRPGT